MRAFVAAQGWTLVAEFSDVADALRAADDRRVDEVLPEARRTEAGWVLDFGTRQERE